MESKPLICIAGKNWCANEAIRIAKERGYDVCHLPNINPGWEPITEAVEVVDIQDLYDNPNLWLYSLESDRWFDPNRFATTHLYNFHFSLLPKFRGCDTTARQIHSGETTAGVTMHMMDAGWDTGDYLTSMSTPIYTKTAEELYNELQRIAVTIFGKVIGGHVWNIKQNVHGASYFPKGSFDYAQHICFRQTAFQVMRQINSLVFPRFQVPQFAKNSIFRARIYQDEKGFKSRCVGQKPGEIIRQEEGRLYVTTLDYIVVLHTEKD